jgi:hypothetical protein
MHHVEITLRWGPLGALGLGREIASEISRRKGGLIRGDAPWIGPTATALLPQSLQRPAAWNYKRFHAGDRLLDQRMSVPQSRKIG